MGVFILKLQTVIFIPFCVLQVLRDGFHQARRDRWQQAEGGDTQSGGCDRQLQKAKSDYVRLGNKGQAARRWRLRPGQYTLRQFHKQVTP